MKNDVTIEIIDLRKFFLHFVGLAIFTFSIIIVREVFIIHLPIRTLFLGGIIVYMYLLYKMHSAITFVFDDSNVLSRIVYKNGCSEEIKSAKSYNCWSNKRMSLFVLRISLNEKNHLYLISSKQGNRELVEKSFINLEKKLNAGIPKQKGLIDYIFLLIVLSMPVVLILFAIILGLKI